MSEQMQAAAVQLVRFEYDGVVGYGLIDDGMIEPVSDPFTGSPRPWTMTIPSAAVRLLPPAPATKVVCFGLTYRAHAAEVGLDVPTEPLLFLKPASSIVGPGDRIVLPEYSQDVQHEAELAVVMGRRVGPRSSRGEVAAAILGYTAANDVTARDLQFQDGQWARAKGFDTFCPVGPSIAVSLDPSALGIQCRVNEEVRQDGSTTDLLHDVLSLTCRAASAMTLEPGDLVLTGSPPGSSTIGPGDSVVVEIDGIGRLHNEVEALASGDTPAHGTARMALLARPN